MLPVEVKEKFIDLRAQGLSYSRISERLRVSKQTLINWGSDFASEISNLQACRLEELQKKYLIAAEKRIRLFGQKLQMISEELDKCDLSDIPTLRLFFLLAKYARLLKDEAAKPRFMSDSEIEQERNLTKLLNNLSRG